jgi:hypothetical protein
VQVPDPHPGSPDRGTHHDGDAAVSVPVADADSFADVHLHDADPDAHHPGGYGDASSDGVGHADDPGGGCDGYGDTYRWR